MADSRKKRMSIGIMLAISFFAVLTVIFMPVFGEGRNGLDYADDMFNKLSKGSSYFIPKLKESNAPFIGQPFTVTMTLDSPEAMEKTAKLFSVAGAAVQTAGSEMNIGGDLGMVLQAILNDSDAMYHNNGAAISGLYGYGEKEVLKNWWIALGKIEKAFKKSDRIEEAKIVSDVMKKAVETAYNYYMVEPQKVADKALLMSGVLIFYVIYTMWWGYAIFYIFEGMGLTMRKAKVKKEV